ncbi:MAG TPA: GEVED domain-containing protein, partial [Edaphocola sp.]|nr:GEVED domain-containing protein [Edaphocola sp.]
AAPCSGTPVAGTVSGPLGALCSGSPFSLSLSGFTLAAGISYQWQSKAASASTWSNITGATSTSYNEASGVTVATDYRAIVTCATSSQSDTSNVVSVTVAPLFPGGTYTINPALPASGTNFQSMGDAVSAISCGIAGPIVFNMAAGNTFNEQVTLPSTIGSSATNTVTFNGNGDTVNFTGTATLPWTIGLNGADYISFNDLVVNGNGNNAYVVHLWNDADHNTFTNCTIMAPENGTSTTQIPFSISGSPTSMATGASGSYNTLDSCTIISGYYNVYLYGNSSAPSVGNQILNSTLKDFYFYGSNNYYQSGLLIKNNIVERPTRTTVSSFYGIYLSTGCVNSTIEQNRIRNQFGGNPVYSGISYNIYASSTAATVGNENKIINNVIGNINGNSSVYGIYMPSAIHTQVYFNTISIDNTAATTGTVYGIYSTGTTGGIDIRNNNIVVTQGGSGTKYCLYYSSATGKTSNNNNLYMGSTSGSNYIGYLSAAQSTLANWQAAAGAGFDLQSVSIDPVFAGPATGNFTPTNAAVNDLGTPIAGITTDFLGATRSTTTPDIGAYEFTVSGCTGTVTAGTASVPSPTVCGGTNILLTATGATAPAGGLTGNWQSRPTAGGPWTNITGATMPSYNLGLGVNVATDFRYWMTCSNNGSSDTSNVVSVSLLPGIQCYCTPTYTNTSDYLSAFSTTGGTQNISYTGTSSSGSYQNLTSQVVGQFQGQIINLSTTYVGGSNTVMIWVDYNGDGMFDDITERVYNYYSSAATNTGSFTVPTSVAAGQYRMRVRSGYGNLTTMDACNNQSYGSALDFTLNVTALIGCSGTVSAGTVSGPAGVCAINSFTLTTIGATSPASGLAGNWQSAPSVTGPWTNISGATTTSLTVGSGITTATSYRYWIACSFSSSTDTSNVVTVTMNPANQCYCTPVYTTGCAVGDDISNVTLNGVTTNINNSTGCSPNAYGDYTNLPPADLNPGGTFSLKVSTSYSYPEDEYATAWIDYNQNGAFEANEVIFNTPNGLQTGGTTQTFVVPSTQAAGLYRMRVRSVYYPSITPVNPCTSESYGETEDYMVQVTAPCPIVPINLGADTTICNNASLTLNAGSQPTGATYTWSTGASTQSITVNTTGTYSVLVSNGTCSRADTINVTVVATPIVSLGADTTICGNAPLTLSAGSQPTGSTYTWSTGASTQTIVVNTTGSYSVVVSNGTCSTSDTINVTVAPSPIVNLGNDTAICAGDSLTLDAGTGTNTSYLWSTGATTQTINVTTSGTYSVSLTNASGCSTTDSINVTVNPYPVVDLGADTLICDGGPYILDAGGSAGDTYLWAPSADTTSSITITTSGTYSVTVTNSSGCSTTDSINVTISELPTVNGIITSGVSPTFNFSPDGAVNVTDYLWDFGAGVTSTLENPTHTYTVLSQKKVYTVTLTVSNDCGDLTVITTVSVQGNKIKDLSLNTDALRLYPNPTQQTVTIDNHSGFKMKNIIITNVLGQQVMKIAVKDNKQIINVAHLVSGLYQVTIEFDEGIVNRKLEVIK